MSDDYHIFVLPEAMALDLMTSDQRRWHAIKKRINAPMYSQMVRIINDVATRGQPVTQLSPISSKVKP